MANPYETPRAMSKGHEAPFWYVLFQQLYWPAWWIGTALIGSSWFGLVSPTVGWAGFGVACAASLGAYVLPSFAGIKAEDYVFLDSRLLKTKGEAYSDVMQRFCDGARMQYDGVAFGFRPENEIACGVVAQSPNINETEAREIADHAQSVFETLIGSSPEFASAVSGKIFRISIMSGMESHSTELFRIVEGAFVKA